METKRITRLLAALPISMLAACASPAAVDSTADALESCYKTKDGSQCMLTPGGVTDEARDVDGDGAPDPFLCGHIVRRARPTGGQSDGDGADAHGGWGGAPGSPPSADPADPAATAPSGARPALTVPPAFDCGKRGCTDTRGGKGEGAAGGAGAAHEDMRCPAGEGAGGHPGAGRPPGAGGHPGAGGPGSGDGNGPGQGPGPGDGKGGSGGPTT
jgi:hypothetical protein